MVRALVALLVGVPLVLADGQSEPPDPRAPKPREVTLDAKPLLGAGPFDKPTRVTTEQELAKSIADKGARAAILKQVNLKKEDLVLFAWSGSGGDRLSFQVSKDGQEVTFTRTPGLTDDLRHHFKLFAIPKKGKYKVAK